MKVDAAATSKGPMKSSDRIRHPLFKALKYYGIRVFLSSTSALLVAITLVLVGVDLPSDLHGELTLGSALFIVLIGPALETLALAGIFYGVRVHISSATTAAVVAGTALAAMHSIAFWGWGLVILIPFLIWSLPFRNENEPLIVRAKKSFLLHAMHNSLAVIAKLIA
jgi:hypothetical protein